MNSQLAGTGTAEAHWRPWLAEQDWPLLDVPAVTAGRRILAVGAHPDDEVLGAGGSLALSAQWDVPIQIIRVTDGEASHPGAAIAPPRLAAHRRQESQRALAELGINPACEQRLTLADGSVAAQPERLRVRLRTEVQPDDLLLAPFSTDGHPDHEACGALAHEAAAERGARLLEYPIWTWHWAVPGDTRVPWHRAGRVALSTSAAVVKRRAIHCFTSQIRPLGPRPEQAAVLPPAVLARFTRQEEVLFA